MKVCIDRVDEGIAVLIVQDDPSSLIRIPVPLLPPGSREGDVLDLILEPDPAAAAAVRERIAGRIERLKKKR